MVGMASSIFQSLMDGTITFNSLFFVVVNVESFFVVKKQF
jgi:hypothetical protein